MGLNNLPLYFKIQELCLDKGTIIDGMGTTKELKALRELNQLQYLEIKELNTMLVSPYIRELFDLLEDWKKQFLLIKEKEKET